MNKDVFETLEKNLNPSPGSCLERPHLQVELNGYQVEVCDEQITIDHDSPGGWESIELTDEQYDILVSRLEAHRDYLRENERLREYFREMPYHYTDELTSRGLKGY